MREIKFRAWVEKSKRLKENTMLYWDDITRMMADGEWRETIAVWGLDKDSDENIILMQYTDIKANDGTEIYEGDIVKIDTYQRRKKIPKIGVVKWDKSVSGFNLYLDDRYIGMLCDAGDHEILGNIYETTELLDLQKDENL